MIQKNVFPKDSLFYGHEDIFEEDFVTPEIRHFQELKKKHPDAILLFRCGDFYKAYLDDAEKTAKTLGTILTKSTSVKDKEGNFLQFTIFPYHALDTYLPRLVRAGHRVAICERL